MSKMKKLRKFYDAIKEAPLAKIGEPAKYEERTLSVGIEPCFSTWNGL